MTYKAMQARCVFAVWIAIPAITATVANAALIETDSMRYTRAAPDAGGQSVDEQNFGPVIYGSFDDLNSETLTVGASTGIGTGEQHSSIAAASYSADLSAAASVSPDFFDIVNGYGESYFEVSFTVTTAMQFTVTGTAGAFGDINGETSDASIRIVSLGGGSPSQTIVALSDSTALIDQSGTLMPGNYRIEAEALAIVSRAFDDASGSATANVQFSMTFTDAPSSPLGDLDCSGTVDADDIAPFVLALINPAAYAVDYSECDIALADVNSDNLRDSRDIAPFIAAILTP